MLKLFAFLLLIIKSVLSANILYISGHTSPSHHIWNRALALGLVNKGHNVTLIGPDEDHTPPTNNFSFILMEGVYDGLHDDFDLNEMISFTTLQMVDVFTDYSLYQCRKYYNSTGLRALWNYPEDYKFDVIIADLTAGTCMLPLAERFGFPPTVGTTPFLLPPYLSYNFGNHLHTSFIPWYSLPYSTEMSFTERIWNTFFTTYDIYLRISKENDEYDKMARETFTELKADWRQLERHVTIILSNTDPILDVPQPLPPNIIATGGLHTRKAEKLPKDLRDLVDNAKSGVIMFSLGTNIQSDKLPEEQQRALLEAFSKLDELVIWKFESDIKDLPNNVVVRKFLPQNDILGHPNVKLFIGHGGALSTQEAIFHGVPMIVMPFIFDQVLNAKAVERKNLGIIMDFNQISADYVLRNIKEILENPLYRNTMKLASKRFRDQPSTPLERGIFWVEYAIRHDGADFLNTPARDMSWIKSSNSDIFALLCSVVSLGVLLIFGISFQVFCKEKNKIKTN